MNIPGIALNEDDSHYFFTRAGQKLTAADVDAWVDAICRNAGEAPAAVPKLHARQLCQRRVGPHLARTTTPSAPTISRCWQAPRPRIAPAVRGWIHTAWQLHHDDIDIYARWIARCRQKGIAPWLSMRMNDVHNVNDERSFIHSGVLARQSPIAPRAVSLQRVDRPRL